MVQAPIRLRIGVYIEQETTLTLVQSMLAEAEHDVFVNPSGSHSLAAYLGIVLNQVRKTRSAPYDVLILGGTGADLLTNIAVLNTLAPLLEIIDIPVLLLAAKEAPVREAWQDFPHVAVLHSSPLSMHQFFRTLGRLTGATTSIPVPRWAFEREQQFSGPEARRASLEERQKALRERQAWLREEERRRVQVRKQWLDQRQEWLDQRYLWLKSRQEWLDAQGKEANPQYEWLAEQQAWLVEEWCEVGKQQKRLSDQKRWLRIYERSMNEETPRDIREARG